MRVRPTSTVVFVALALVLPARSAAASGCRLSTDAAVLHLRTQGTACPSARSIMRRFWIEGKGNWHSRALSGSRNRLKGHWRSFDGWSCRGGATYSTAPRTNPGHGSARCTRGSQSVSAKIVYREIPVGLWLRSPAAGREARSDLFSWHSRI